MPGISREASRIINGRILVLYEKGFGCRQIGQELEMDRVSVYKRLRRLRRTRNPVEATALQEVEGSASPFSRGVSAERLRHSAIAIATQWFLDRGYTPSIPVTAVAYDLIVESDVGLQRVQVKSTTSKERSGAWIVRIARAAYDQKRALNSMGRRSRARYSADEVDLFFVVTGDRSLYLVPLSATQGAYTLTLDTKYKQFRLAP